LDVGGVRRCGGKGKPQVIAEVGEEVDDDGWEVGWEFLFRFEGKGIGEEWLFIGDEWNEGAGEEEVRGEN
jgi:hypothetical protein